MIRQLQILLGLVVTVLMQTSPTRASGFPAPRDERGLSQSTENAILLAGAVTVAGLVITAVTVFVQSRLPK